MTRDDDFSDFVPDSGESDDVEILEVIGVEEDPSPSERSAEPAEPEQPEEFLLGFDEELPGRDALADELPPPQSVSASDDSDKQLLQRLRADYDNLRKRIAREREEYELHANSALVSRLLPVLDNLERAMAVDASTDSGDALREGLVMIHKQLTEELRREGLIAIESIGQVFDPTLHDAVATDPDSEHPPNKVIHEFQRGYKFQDRVLRHAMVRVSTRGADHGTTDNMDDSEDSK